MTPMSAELAWLAPFLPLLRCPASGLPLHLASAQELAARGLAADQQMLVSQDGAHAYPVENGIPVLLPPDHGNIQPAIPKAG